MVLARGVSSSTPVFAVKIAMGEYRRGPTGSLEAHSPGGRQRATIQHVAIGVHRCESCRLWSAKDRAADADDIVAVEISAAAIKTLNAVIAILHYLLCAERRGR